MNSSEQYPFQHVDSFYGNTSDPAHLIHRACPVCQSLHHRTVNEFSDFQFYSDSAIEPKRIDVRTVQCRTCFALFMNPSYSDLGFGTLFSEAAQSYGATEARALEQVDWIEQHQLLIPQSTVLDVGCGDGRFLAHLPQTVRRVGLDIDQPSIERGRERYGKRGVEFIHAGFESFRIAKSPKLITMFHVLEHLSSPRNTLAQLRAHATNETRLLVEVPILDNSRTNDINGFFSVQHQTHFSKKSLENCLVRGGWRPVLCHQQTDYNGFRVIAEPSPPIDDTAIHGNVEDINALTSYLAHWQSAIQRVEATIFHFSSMDRCIIWGAGAHVEFLYQLTSLFVGQAQRRFLLVDSDPIKQGTTWRGISVHKPCRAIFESLEREVPLVVSSYGSQEKIADAAIELGAAKQSIVKLYDRLRIY